MNLLAFSVVILFFQVPVTEPANPDLEQRLSWAPSLPGLKR